LEIADLYRFVEMRSALSHPPQVCYAVGDMAKSRKKSADPEAPIVPRIGDKVTIPRVGTVLEVNHVASDGTEVTLGVLAQTFNGSVSKPTLSLTSIESLQPEDQTRLLTPSL